MTIGILKEAAGENRVAILASDAAALVTQNVKVIVENGAGENAFISDADYKEAGAETGSRDQVLGCDLVIGINPPSEEDIKKIPSGKAIIGIFQPLVNNDLVKLMQDQGLTCMSLDAVPRSTRAQAMDVLSSMATVAGYKAVLAAASNLPSFFPMFMTAAGSIKPAKVLILGAGVAGLQAIATARKLGAVVEAFDVRAAAKEEVLSLGAKFVEVEGATDDTSAGGYAVEQSEEYKQKQQALIKEHSERADVIITTAQIPGRKSPIQLGAVTAKSRKTMKQ
jgi:NAD(P) transhydrogenase subunit alpha